MDIDNVLHSSLLESGGVPHVVIINYGNYTSLYVDGEMITNCVKMTYTHKAKSAPVLETECAPPKNIT